MAAKETENSYQVRIESVVNGWLVDYYFFLAVEFFKNEQYEDFCAIIDILDCKYNPLPVFLTSLASS